MIKERMAKREENFLKIVRKGIFGYKRSPYLALLKLAGYEFKDIEKLVSKFGIEGALNILKEEGVYITIEEFKHRKPVIRRGREFIFKEGDFDNPYTKACYSIRSGATRSPGTRVMADFDFLSDAAVNLGTIIDIWGLGNFPIIMLRPAFPYGPGMEISLQLSKFGVYPKRWLSMIDEKAIPLSLRSKLGVFYILNMSKFWGADFALPEFLSLKDIRRVLEIIKGLAKKYNGCYVSTYVSSAVRLCLAAKDAGMDLKGVVFHGGGEPLTFIRQNEIISSGAEFIINYAFTEACWAGSLCLNSRAIDDIHIFKDRLALVSHKREIAGSDFDAFLATTLLPSAPKILLNTETGDYGIIESRKCACPYEELGYNTHIHSIRSFEKLTGEGMTFYGSGLTHIVESVLPARFGGSSIDYQFVEEEDRLGFTRLCVLVSPKVGYIDESEVIRTVLDELAKEGDSQRVMAKAWETAGTIRVRRDYPLLTKAGKQYSLYRGNAGMAYAKNADIAGKFRIKR